MSEGRNEEDKKPNIKPTHITLKVKNQDNHKVFFRVERNSGLKTLMDDYCMEKGLPIDSIPFLFDGDRIKGHQTPDELEMEDGDEIDAMEHMIGGTFKV